MAIDWQLPGHWGTRTLGTVAPEESVQIRPAGHPTTLFNYWGLEAIDKGQFEEPQPNFVPGSQVVSICVRFGPKHVLYSKLRPYLNKVVVPSVEGIGTTEWVVLKPDPAMIDRSFLAYALRTHSFVTFASESSTGARMPRARKETLWDADIPLPCPDDPARSLETQRRIVARIEALFAELRECRKLHQAVVEDTNRLMEAVLAEVFGQIGKYTSATKTIEAMTTVTSGGTPSRSRTDYYGGTIPWVKTGELKDNTIMDTEEHITEQAVRESNAKEFPVNTLLVAMYGQGQTRGRTGVLGTKAATNQACCAIYPNPEEFDSFFLQFWFRHIYSNLRQQSELRGGSQPNLNQGIIKRLNPPLPTPREQSRYAEYLRQAEAEIAEMQKAQNEDGALLGEMEQSILAQAFRGEL
jgi:type I restriction enzyme S subunit